MALSEFPRLNFDPFVELRRMQSEMSRLFSRFSTAATREFPPINIWLGENTVVVTAELPGVTREDVNLNLQEDLLTVAGRREPKRDRKTSTGNVASAPTVLSRVRSSCPSGIPKRFRHVSTTVSWKSNCSGWKHTAEKNRDPRGVT
jgi:hypothetical protein